MEKYIIALFDNEYSLKESINNLIKNKITIYNVHTPYPIHGINKLIGGKTTKLPFFAFFGAIAGLILSFSMMFYMTNNWNVNVGGKPIIPFISFIPICFEVMILCSAYSIGISFIISVIISYKDRKNYLNKLSINDKYVIVIDIYNCNFNKRNFIFNTLKISNPINITTT